MRWLVLSMLAVLVSPALAKDKVYLLNLDLTLAEIARPLTEPKLIRRFGARNVTSADVAVGEGESEKGTILFGENPEKRIFILWHNNQAKVSPKSICIRDPNSLWHLPNGISIGTSLKKLERLNSGPFKMSGFDWDYAGTILDWHGGRLRSMNSKEFGIRIIIRLDAYAGDRSSKLTRAEESSILGDRDLISSIAALQKLDPTVYEICVAND